MSTDVRVTCAGSHGSGRLIGICFCSLQAQPHGELTVKFSPWEFSGSLFLSPAQNWGIRAPWLFLMLKAEPGMWGPLQHIPLHPRNSDHKRRTTEIEPAPPFPGHCRSPLWDLEQDPRLALVSQACAPSLDSAVHSQPRICSEAVASLRSVGSPWLSQEGSSARTCLSLCRRRQTTGHVHRGSHEFPFPAYPLGRTGRNSQIHIPHRGRLEAELPASCRRVGNSFTEGNSLTVASQGHWPSWPKSPQSRRGGRVHGKFCPYKVVAVLCM